jgi:hypothetical protein
VIYRVAAPLVVVKSRGKVVYRAAGQLVDSVSEADAARLVSRGMVVPIEDVDQDAGEVESPAGDPPADPPAAPPVPDTPVEKPKKTAAVEEWRAYARTQGLTEADVADATKADLIALVG